MSTNTINKNINLKRNNSTVFFLMVCLFVFSNNVFSQDIIKVSEANCVEQIELKLNTQNQVTSLDSQMDFVGWFMGTKQAQNLDINKDKNTSTTSNKKQILSSGITPNRVLYRTFMKKVISQDSAIV